ncbi:hypothetical protein O0L34_g5772 [Tuta absoluta]|nr:hypothetical protein O0L34_g5772 [Tuta absoluta]
MRNYRRKTDRGTTPITVLQNASKAVLLEKRKIRAVAREAGINHVTLSRFVRNIKTGAPATAGYCPRLVFHPDQEKALAISLSKYSWIYSGLTLGEVKKLMYNCAVQLNLPKIPPAWHKHQETGVDWVKGLLKRNPTIPIRIPKIANAGKSYFFNRRNFSEFFTKLGDVIQTHNLEPSRIWNLDETKVTTFVPSPGVKQIDAIATMEQRTVVTVELAANAEGTILPPMFVFPRLEYEEQFVSDGPPGSIGAGNSSGLMTTIEFLRFINHFVEYTKSSPDNPVLLLLDNHSSHVDVEVVEKAITNSIILLSFPPCCTHKLQPLEIGIHKLFNTHYAKAQKNWQQKNPGKTISLYEIPEVVRHALPLAATPSNIVNAFKKAGIYPYNPDIFADEDIPPAPPNDANESDQTRIEEKIKIEVPQPGPSNISKFPNNILIPATFIKQELVERSFLQGRNPSAEKKMNCIICLDLFSKLVIKEKWIECDSCKRWAHAECLESEDFHTYVCAYCDFDDEAFGKKLVG